MHLAVSISMHIQIEIAINYVKGAYVSIWRGDGSGHSWFAWLTIRLSYNLLEMFYLNSTLNFGIPPVLVFQWEVYYEVDRLVTGLTAQQEGTTAWWYSNKTSLTELL